MCRQECKGFDNCQDFAPVTTGSTFLPSLTPSLMGTEMITGTDRGGSWREKSCRAKEIMRIMKGESQKRDAQLKRTG